jgi:ABC-type transport system involved in multi-copper enzyme maturation permease subunit
VTTYAPSLPAGRVSLTGLLGSEWTKLRTVRSTMWTLGATVFIGVAVSVLSMAEVRAQWTTTSASARVGFDPVGTSLTGAAFGGALLLGVLGILVISGEYATGTIRVTLAAEPRRPMALAAKVLVFAAVSLITAEVTTFASFLIGQAFLTSPAPHATLSSPGALRAMAGTGLFLCVVGLFALGIAAIVRHTAGAIGLYVFVVLVLPIINQSLPSSLGNQLHRFLPLTIGHAMTNPSAVPHAFGPWTGFAVLCGYAVLPLVLGTVLLVRRDA